MKDVSDPHPNRARISRRKALGGFGGGLVAAALSPGASEAAPLSRSKANRETTLPVGRRGCTVTPLHGGMILVAGGIQTGVTGTVQIYDPGRNEWLEAAPMNTPRAHHAAAALHDGRVLVMGGRFIGVLSSAEIYDPRGDEWTQVASMHTPRAEHGAALAHQNGVLVTGGFNRIPLSSVELYEAFADRWVIL